MWKNSSNENLNKPPPVQGTKAKRNWPMPLAVLSKAWFAAARWLK
jgi:hypothetical protein